jgi:hypothetical protein
VAQTVQWQKRRGGTNVSGTNVGGKNVGGRNVGGRKVAASAVSTKHYTMPHPQWHRCLFITFTIWLSGSQSRKPTSYYSVGRSSSVVSSGSSSGRRMDRGLLRGLRQRGRHRRLHHQAGSDLALRLSRHCLHHWRGFHFSGFLFFCLNR